MCTTLPHFCCIAQWMIFVCLLATAGAFALEWVRHFLKNKLDHHRNSLLAGTLWTKGRYTFLGRLGKLKSTFDRHQEKHNTELPARSLSLRKRIVTQTSSVMKKMKLPFSIGDVAPMDDEHLQEMIRDCLSTLSEAGCEVCTPALYSVFLRSFSCSSLFFFRRTSDLSVFSATAFVVSADVDSATVLQPGFRDFKFITSQQWPARLRKDSAAGPRGHCI